MVSLYKDLPWQSAVELASFARLKSHRSEKSDNQCAAHCGTFIRIYECNSLQCLTCKQFTETLLYTVRVALTSPDRPGKDLHHEGDLHLVGELHLVGKLHHRDGLVVVVGFY